MQFKVIKTKIYTPEPIDSKYELEINLPVASAVNKPKLFALMAGSMRHYQWMLTCAPFLEMVGNWNILLPIPKLPLYRENINDPKAHKKIVERYAELMDMAELLYVVNIPGRPIGTDTHADIITAKEKGLEICYMVD